MLEISIGYFILGTTTAMDNSIHFHLSTNHYYMVVASFSSMGFTIIIVAIRDIINRINYMYLAKKVNSKPNPNYTVSNMGVANTNSSNHIHSFVATKTEIEITL